MADGLREHIALVRDPETRVDGRGLLGGSPLRLLRLTPDGAAAATALLAERRAPRDATEAAVARLLLDAGLAHPEPLPAATRAVAACTVAVVVPVHDDAAGLDRLLPRLPPDLDVVVVDDGSADPAGVDAVVHRHRARPGGVRVVRHERPLGPGPARDAGWRATDADVVVLVDADVEPRDGWLDRLLPHLADDAVAAAAPRVASPLPRRGRVGALARYESVRSPLDLGDRPGRVAPGARVPYVPTAALVVRRSVLEELGGFDPGLRFGEDVDLVWRAVEAGWTVRYDPTAVVAHRPRPDWPGLVRQRVGYGSAAAPLDARHPGAVAPLEVNVASLAAWALVASGGRVRPWLGVGVGAASTAALVPRLADRVDAPVREAVRLAGAGTLRAGPWIGRAVARTWLPLALPLLAARRGRRAVALAVVGPAVLDALGERGGLDPVRFVAAHVLDDAAYATGVWKGVVTSGRTGCLRPRVTGIGGRPALAGLARRARRDR